MKAVPGGEAVLQIDDIPLGPLGDCSGIRLAVLGAWPPHHDPVSGHLFSAPADSVPLSPVQQMALRAFKEKQKVYISEIVERYAAEELREAGLIRVNSPRGILARVAMKLLGMGLNARDLLLRLDAANARLTASLPAASVREIAIWAANARRGVTR